MIYFEINFKWDNQTLLFDNSCSFLSDQFTLHFKSKRTADYILVGEKKLQMHKELIN